MYAFEIVNELTFWQWELVTNSQDIAAVCESIGIKTDHVGAMYVMVGDGDYLAILITEDTVPKVYSHWYTLPGWKEYWE